MSKGTELLMLGLLTLGSAAVLVVLVWFVGFLFTGEPYR
jgi:hypothetical protein